jgi:hypothetical protein
MVLPEPVCGVVIGAGGERCKSAKAEYILGVRFYNALQETESLLETSVRLGGVSAFSYQNEVRKYLTP